MTTASNHRKQVNAMAPTGLPIPCKSVTPEALAAAMALRLWGSPRSVGFFYPQPLTVEDVRRIASIDAARK